MYNTLFLLYALTFLKIGYSIYMHVATVKPVYSGHPLYDPTGCNREVA